MQENFMRTIYLVTLAALLIGCVPAPTQPTESTLIEVYEDGTTSKPVFEKFEDVYACVERLASGGVATDRFLQLNNVGDTAKVRFLGRDYIGKYVTEDLQRKYFFGYLENSKRHRYLVVIETDGDGFLYEFSEKTSQDDKVKPTRALFCFSGSIMKNWNDGPVRY